jgi:hypothetical protein
MQTQNRAPRLVLRRALPPLQHITSPATFPAFELTFLCGGHDFKALIRARNSQAAAAEALIELGHQFPDFNPLEARLVAAVETR